VSKKLCGFVLIRGLKIDYFSAFLAFFTEKDAGSWSFFENLLDFLKYFSIILN